LLSAGFIEIMHYRQCPGEKKRKPLFDGNYSTGASRAAVQRFNHEPLETSPNSALGHQRVAKPESAPTLKIMSAVHSAKLAFLPRFPGRERRN
jgi:hypothetical protein